jgi:hypothetical protein
MTARLHERLDARSDGRIGRAAGPPSPRRIGPGAVWLASLTGQGHCGTTVVQTDPDTTNEPAIRCHTAAGFRAVGRVAIPDGSGLVMRCTRGTLAGANPRPA